MSPISLTIGGALVLDNKSLDYRKPEQFNVPGLKGEAISVTNEDEDGGELYAVENVGPKPGEPAAQRVYIGDEAPNPVTFFVEEIEIRATFRSKEG